MVIKYSAPELIAIGEMVILKECIARIPDQRRQQELEPHYHQVYVPHDTFTPQRNASFSISADNFLQDFAQFQHNLDQSIQLNRDINWQDQQTNRAQQEQRQQKLTNSVAEFFKKAQQNFHPNPNQADSSSSRARRLSEVEAELLGQLRGHIHL